MQHEMNSVETVSTVTFGIQMAHHNKTLYSFFYFSLSLNCTLVKDHMSGFSDLVDLWVIKIKKAYDPLRT